MDFGLNKNQNFALVTGKPQMSDVAKDAVDQVDAGFEFFDRSGTQSGSASWRSQPKVPKWIE